jgi:hypothetical protein
MGDECDRNTLYTYANRIMKPNKIVKRRGRREA